MIAYFVPLGTVVGDWVLVLTVPPEAEGAVRAMVVVTAPPELGRVFATLRGAVPPVLAVVLIATLVTPTAATPPDPLGGLEWVSGSALPPEDRSVWLATLVPPLPRSRVAVDPR